ncbi:MAG: PCC domain-containing protein [bacterium]
MDVQEFRSKRWFRLLLEDDESLKASIRDASRERGIGFGWIQVVGEIKDPKLASGYRLEENGDTPEKIMVEPGESHHVLGVGSVRKSGDGREVHLHGPMGRDGETTTGCWAGDQSVFKGLEVVLVELESVED